MLKLDVGTGNSVISDAVDTDTDEPNDTAGVAVRSGSVVGVTEGASPILGVLKFDVAVGKSETIEAVEAATADPNGTAGVAVDTLLDPNK